MSMTRDAASGRGLERAIFGRGLPAVAKEAVRRRAGRTCRWDKPLEEVVRALTEPVPLEEPQLGLQFELKSTGPAQRAGKRPTAGEDAKITGILLHPVVRSPRSKWVRTGISWPKLDYGYGYGFSSSPLAAERRRVLRELAAVGRLSSHSSYGYSSYGSDTPLRLEEFGSRRLWDLLAQAVELGIPLVQSGNKARGVRVLREPAVAGIDLVDAGGRLRMSPYLEAAGDRVPLQASLLIGRPPHGVAWWDATSETVMRQLCLAPFSHPLGSGEQALLGTEPLEVPARDRKRFLHDFYPRLARSLPVVSSDESVELPEPPRSVVVLWVRHQGQRSVVVWQRGVEDSPERHDLLTAQSKDWDRSVDDTVKAVTEIVSSLPAMVEDTFEGERLASPVELSGMDAVRLVTSVLPALAQLPGLVIETDGEAPSYREAIEAPTVSLRSSDSSFDTDWFDLRVEVQVDGEDVPFYELFTALAEGQSHLVLPSGTYFSLDRPELAELANLIAEARAMQDRDSDAPDHLRVSRFHAGLWEDLRGLGVSTAQAEAWESAVRGLLDAADIAVEPPEGLEATLRPYQESGFAWLAFLYRNRLGGILADDMGLGKTLQALSLVCHARQRLGVEKPFLVVAPTSVVGNWVSECERFAPELRALPITETRTRRWVPLEDMADKADLVVTSYTLFRLEHGDYEAIPWAGVLLDEAQFVKNPRSIVHQQLKAMAVPFKLALTGTPMENNLKELWAQLSIAAPGLFPRLDRFVEQYATPIERRGDGERLAQLRRRIHPLILRRTKQQVESDLPDKQEQVLELELAPKHRRRYLTHLQRERQKILGLLGDMDRHRIEIFRSLTLLRQAALDISLVDDRSRGIPSTKLDALTDMLDEIVADGHRVLVFSQFTRFLSAAAERARAAGIGHCYLDGKTRQRQKVIDSFKAGDAPVFFISLKAGGFGLNLTEADYCILLDPWWNPATEAQAVDRTHRIGQHHNVMVYRLVAKDTIEEKVMALKARKAALFANVIDGGGFETAALSAADIRGLLE